MFPQPRVLTAPNAGAFTLDGTRAHLVGEDRAALIDPGPDVASHVRALARLASGAREVIVLVTHAHADHAGAARRVADELGARVAGPEDVSGVDEILSDADRISTDAGSLVAVDTPGHTRHHLCFHWPEARAVFVGDLLLGRGETTWVGEYPGCVADYLHSLARLAALRPQVLFPAHGPPIDDPAAVLARYEAHRRARIRQVEEALRERPDADARELLDVVYPEPLPDRVRRAALLSVEALVHHVQGR